MARPKQFENDSNREAAKRSRAAFTAAGGQIMQVKLSPVSSTHLRNIKGRFGITTNNEAIAFALEFTAHPKSKIV